MVSLLPILLLLRRRRHKAQNGQLDKVLRPFRKEEVRSVVIPDGIGGLIEIDRLILTDRGLLVIETYPISGHLFGSEHIDQWTQIIDGRSFKFANPLRHIHNAKHALQLLAPKLPIICRVVFTVDSDFPKGRPDDVSTMTSLEQDLQPILQMQKMPASSQLGWQRVLRIARKDGQAAMKEVAL